MNIYVVIAASYVLGSIPFGYLLVRVFKGEDVRASGSGNIGATNVSRTSPALGIATLLLDAAKGLAAVLLASELLGAPPRPLLLTTAALFAVLGHMFPLWLKFCGGKGVATTLGAFALLTPKSILCMIVLFVLLVAASRYISLGSVMSAAVFPAFAWLLHEYADPRQLLLIALVSALVIWKHRQNILRLLAGAESKFGSNRASRPGATPPSNPSGETHSVGAPQ